MARLSRLIAEELPRLIRADLLANAQEAAKYLETRYKESLGQDSPPPSRPGQFPGRVTGRLQREAYGQAELRGTTAVIVLASPTPYAASLAARGRLGPRAVIEAERRPVLDILRRKRRRFFGRGR